MHKDLKAAAIELPFLLPDLAIIYYNIRTNGS